MSYQTSSMETTTTILQPHSFSYSWLANLNSISHDDHDEISFIEMDPRLPPSKRFLRVSSSDHFCFDFPVSDDQLVHGNNNVIEMDHRTVVHDDHYTSTITSKKCDRRRWSLRKRLSMRFLQRFLKYLLRPFSYRRSYQSHGQVSAATLSPRTSLAYSSADDNWRSSCDSESSIYEAVLYCKRTQGVI
ncbi:hypothetical protein CASFOL_003267 [Castilleja foliolosa]|uniref:Membrane-associated kinase regulator 6 n=1 Tax=Castilleja foliolosa TaxID=1961234 RepID=A0ABD3EH25_9LAMI